MRQISGGFGQSRRLEHTLGTSGPSNFPHSTLPSTSGYQQVIDISGVVNDGRSTRRLISVMWHAD
jgi:hypothetical protein